MELNKKFILYTAGAFDWRAEGIYDSKKQICDQLREDWGIVDMTDEQILDLQGEYEFKVTECNYYPETKLSI